MKETGTYVVYSKSIGFYKANMGFSGSIEDAAVYKTTAQAFDALRVVNGMSTGGQCAIFMVKQTRTNTEKKTLWRTSIIDMLRDYSWQQRVIKTMELLEKINEKMYVGSQTNTTIMDIPNE